MTSSFEPTGQRHHGGCRFADTRPSVTAMPTLQLLNNCTNVKNNAGEVSAGRQTVSFFYCWRARLFTMMMPIVSKAHHPANAIMMVVNDLAPKRHQYTSKHHSQSSAIPVYSGSLDNHVTQRIYRITAIKQAMLKAVRWVGNPHVLLLLVGSSSPTDNALCISTQYWTVHSW